MKTIINKVQITAYGFSEFLQLTQEKIKEGFEFNFESNEDYPTSFGTFFSAGMVQYEPEVKETRKNKAKVVEPEKQEPETKEVSTDLEVESSKA